MNVVKATREFEAWLGHRTRLIEKDLRLKHKNMKAAVFPFLRATFYRWAQVWPEVCSDLADAPAVLAVGDLHVENFGTWRDVDGRLIWGVNDFDEAFSLPYPYDLVRLAVSARLAAEAQHISLTPAGICDALVEGYSESLQHHGRPYVLEEDHNWLRTIANNELRDPVHFWGKMDVLTPLRVPIPVSATDAIEHLMPAHELDYVVVHRIAGLGSLGHARYVAIANWNGGKIAREAKALVSSACYWAKGDHGPSDILYQAIISRCVRCLDPFVQLRGHWIARRLSPHCCRIELTDMKPQGQELRLLHAMGWETANIHLGTKSARKTILNHLSKLKGKWLEKATEKMLKAVREDWKTWAKDGYA